MFVVILKMEVPGEKYRMFIIVAANHDSRIGDCGLKSRIYEGGSGMAKEKKVLYMVQCAFDPEHEFEKAFTVEEGSEQKETKVEAFCPFCDKRVMATVKGKVVPEESILRRFDKV